MNPQKKPHPLKGRKQPAEAIAKRKATYAAKRMAKLAIATGNGDPAAWGQTQQEPKIWPVLDNRKIANTRDAAVYLSNALAKWPNEKKRGIARLYVELALATLEGRD